MEPVLDRRMVDLRLLAGIVRARRYLFLLILGAVMLLTVLYLHIMPPSYTVSMQVAPTGGNQQQAGGGFGGLAKLAGVDLGGASGGAGQFRLFLSALMARDTADLLARDPDLMRALFPKQWSQSENRWRQPSSLTRPLTHGIASLLGFPTRSWHAPDGDDVAQYLADNLEIYEDPKGPVVTLRIDSDAPLVAKQVLQKLVPAVDGVLRRRALKRATDYVGYLSHELNVETVTEYRQTLMAHLAEQQQTLMMANASVSFAMQVFSQPSIPRSPSAPKALVLLLTAFVFGSGLGVALCVIGEMAGWAPMGALRLIRSRSYRSHSSEIAE